MANITNTVADTSGFIAQAWATKGLLVLRANLAAVKAIAQDVDFEPGWKGKTLTIPYPGTFAAAAKTAGNVATVQAPSGGSSVAVTLSNHQTVDFIIEDVAEATANVSLIEKFAGPAAIALAEKVEADTLALASGYTAPTVGVMGTPMARGSFVSARKALVDVKAPQTDRSLILSSSDYAGLLNDSNLATYFAYNATQANTDASVPRIMGFDIYESQLTPTVDGTAVAHSLQTLTMTGVPTGGTFTLTYSGQTTAAIPFNATAAQVEAKIAALSNIGAGKVRCSAGSTNFPAASSTVIVALYGITTPAAFTHTDSFTGGASPAVAVTDNTGAVNVNQYMHKNAALIAVRPFQLAPAGSGVMQAVAMDSESGLSLRCQMQYNIQNRGLYVAFDILYGLTALRPNQGGVVLS